MRNLRDTIPFDPAALPPGMTMDQYINGQASPANITFGPGQAYDPSSHPALDPIVEYDRQTPAPAPSEMIRGQLYTFHFAISAATALINPGDPNTIARHIATHDSNFANPQVSMRAAGGVSQLLQPTAGFDVTFTYNGQGSSIAAAGIELQNVIGNCTFVGAEIGYGNLSASGAIPWGAILTTVGLCVGGWIIADKVL